MPVTASKSYRRFNLQQLLLVIAAFALSFGLLNAAIRLQSGILLWTAIVLLAGLLGGSIGFVLRGANGAFFGVIIGVGIVFLIVLSLFPSRVQ